MHGEFQKLETIILGISPDGEASHQNFISKYDVPFETYGAFGEKKMYGKVTSGVIRSTVWVGPDGKVRKHWRKVAKAGDHPAKVLEALKSALRFLE